MSLESFTGKIKDLVITNPTGADPRSQGDDHLRGIKWAVQNDAVSKTDDQVMTGNLSVAGGGTGAQVLQADEVKALAVPTGTILDFAGPTPPAGFLPCNGAAVSRTTYAALFAAIGVTWGAGDTTSTFNVPNLQRRTTVGAGGTGTAVLGSVLGNVGGAETHLLTGAESGVAIHNHSANATLSASLQPGAHGYASSLSGATGVVTDSVLTAPEQSAQQAHNNLQPSAVVNKIIKT